jgi:hypothetical protein
VLNDRCVVADATVARNVLVISTVAGGDRVVAASVASLNEPPR